MLSSLPGSYPNINHDLFFYLMYVCMHAQVQTCKIAMAGEHAAVNLAVHASSSCPAQLAFVSASYADGGEPPLLSKPRSGNCACPQGYNFVFCRYNI